MKTGDGFQQCYNGQGPTVYAATKRHHHGRSVADLEEKGEPPVLSGWEERQERTTRVNRILGERDPDNLLSGSGNLRWLQPEDGPMLVIRTPHGTALIDKSEASSI
ncbi:MAG: hypothetical protein QNL33_03740 [Akkermansiaceae bacterium]|jgi:hypothetical protein